MGIGLNVNFLNFSACLLDPTAVKAIAPCGNFNPRWLNIQILYKNSNRAYVQCGRNILTAFDNVHIEIEIDQF